MPLSRLFIAMILLFGLLTPQAQACGPDTNCEIGDRHYRIRMPENHDGTSKIGAIVYAHGYRGSAAGAMRNKSFAKMASELGVAFIAAKSYREDWRIPGVPRNTQTDGNIELAYFDALIEDVTSRFPIDRSRIMATGFSAGGMMVWNLICQRSQLFAGFVPISGTFWEPEPVTCTTPPANVIHIHGDNDPVVPLMGRKIADTHQGQVPQVLEMYSSYGGYQSSNSFEEGALDCETSIAPTSEFLTFCLFAGGHSFRTEYVRQAWRMLEKAGKL